MSNDTSSGLKSVPLEQSKVTDVPDPPRAGVRQTLVFTWTPSRAQDSREKSDPLFMPSPGFYVRYVDQISLIPFLHSMLNNAGVIWSLSECRSEHGDELYLLIHGFSTPSGYCSLKGQLRSGVAAA